MGQLNVREFPAELLKRAKIAAIERGTTLKEFVIQALEAAIKAQKGSKR